MEIEKRGSKVGFLHLFDWNSKSKSRKKLFSSTSHVHEETKQEYTHVNNLIQRDENNNECLSYKTCNDSNTVPSVNSDEGYVTKSPSVVAKLMGLDSLPSSICEPPLTPFHDLSTIKNPLYVGDHQIKAYNIISNEFDEFCKNPINPSSQNLRNRSIKKFQTEMLPSRSAKTIQMTRCKLLSPIKSPRFIPKNIRADIMEAAAKFIDTGPQMTNRRKAQPFRPSSSPLRIQDLKEKMQDAQKVVKHEKMKLPAIAINTSVKNKEKPVSLAVQAKLNVQKRERFDLNRNTGYTNQKDIGKLNSNRVSKSQVRIEKGGQTRATTTKTSSVFRQNDQKQNSIPTMDKLTTAPNSKGIYSNNLSHPHKSINTLVSSQSGSKRSSSVNAREDFSSCKTKKLPQKKRLANKDVYFEEIVGDNLLSNRDNVSEQCCVAINQDTVNREKCTDVVSFTFTSPIKSSVSMAHDCHHPLQSSRLSFNEIDGDDLSALLERKLRELTSKVENRDLFQDGTDNALSSLQDFASDEPRSLFYNDCSMTGRLGLHASDEWQDFGLEEFVLINEPSSPGGSCYYSSQSQITDCGTGNKQSPIQSYETICYPTRDQPPEKNEAPTNWELECIRRIVYSTDLLCNDFASGKARTVTFEHLENELNLLEPRFDRRVWYDCVVECLDIKCRQFCSRAKWGALLKDKEVLVDELYKEVLGWRSMDAVIVDEVVENDMGFGLGKWLDFEKEAFEEGVAIEEAIMTCLVVELTVDLLS